MRCIQLLAKAIVLFAAGSVVAQTAVSHDVIVAAHSGQPGSTGGVMLYEQTGGADQRPSGQEEGTVTFDVSGIPSYGSWGDPGNAIVVLDAAAELGLPIGTPLGLTGIGWDVTLEAFDDGSGVNRLSDIRLAFDDNVNPDGAFFFINPGVGDAFPGIGSYERPLENIPGPPVVLPNGELNMQFFEGHDSIPGADDGLWVSGTLTLEFRTPELKFDPSSLDFGDVGVGTSSAPRVTMLQNIGDVDATGLIFQPVGNGFETDTDDCGTTLPAGASCGIVVTFTPTDLGPASETMQVFSLDFDSAHFAVLSLAGNGVSGVPELTFDPPSLDFGQIDVNDTSPPQTATLENTGDIDVTGLTFGAPGGGFDAATSTCGAGLAVGQSCQLSVTFAPAEPGPASATLEVTSDQDASAGLGLAGMGVSDGVVTPVALVVDPEALLSDGNEVFEPGELAEVAPAWRNDGLLDESFTGTASSFNGSDGANYLLPLEDTDYGNVEPGATASCLDTGVCYWMGVNDPAVRPATHWQATFDETLSEGATHTWSLHIGDSFVDVPRTNPFYPAVETLLHHGVTGGCTATEYCPTGTNTRGQMAVFLLKAAEGGEYAPPACEAGQELFADVSFDSPLCPWIEELAARQVTSGCGGGNYCPGSPVTRAQMAVFLLKAFEGGSYTPPECSGEFTDVACPSTFADWVEELSERGVTGGCSAAPPAYCPAAPVTRQQMAVFVTKTFGLTLYGP